MQKKFVLLCFLAAVLSAASQAQVIQKGQVLTGINLTTGGIYNASPWGGGGGSTSTRISELQLEAGKALKNNFVVGARIGTGPSFNTTDIWGYPGYTYASYNSYKTIGAGVFARYYVPMSPKLAVFAEGALNYASGSVRYNTTSLLTGDVITGNRRFWSIDAGMSLGLNYSISKRVKFELGFNNLLNFGWSRDVTNDYYTNTGQTSKFSQNNLRLNPLNNFNRFNISFGIKVALGKGR